MDKFFDDYYRNTGVRWNSCVWGGVQILMERRIRFLLYLRILQSTKYKLLHPLAYIGRYIISHSCGLEIVPQTIIGEGFRMIHPYNITINPEAKLGKNINIYKGATIGYAKGKKEGVPIVGDNVQIGINATIVGGIEIGNDVLIAPNTFINEDVPSHSIVLGNPAIILSRDNATKEYIEFHV